MERDHRIKLARLLVSYRDIAKQYYKLKNTTWELFSHPEFTFEKYGDELKRIHTNLGSLRELFDHTSEAVCKKYKRQLPSPFHSSDQRMFDEKLMQARTQLLHFNHMGGMGSRTWRDLENLAKKELTIK